MRPIAKDEHEREFLEIVDRHGWHVMMVHGDDAGPGFAYSTGIFERTGRPELIVFGLKAKVSHFLVNDYAERILKGEVFEVGRRYENFLDDALVTFLSVTDRSVGSEYTTWTSWYYQNGSYPLLQGVWPDKKSGAFPWEPGYAQELIECQPLLAPPPSVH
jgi:hypothetical protein